MALAEAGAIPNLARLARAHDTETQRHAARAIGSLAANASCQHEIGNAVASGLSSSAATRATSSCSS